MVILSHKFPVKQNPDYLLEHLREYKKLTDVDDEIYIGFYITDFSDPVIPVVPENQDNSDLFFHAWNQHLGNH